MAASSCSYIFTHIGISVYFDRKTSDLLREIRRYGLATGNTLEKLM